MNAIGKIATVIALCALSFIGGWMTASRNVVTYSLNGQKISFNRTLPVYGLPLVDDEMVLATFKLGHTEEALADLEGNLDYAIYDAERRRPYLDGDDLKELDKCLTTVATYRQQFPRPVTEPSNSVSRVLWPSEKQKENDSFLKGFAPSSTEKVELK